MVKELPGETEFLLQQRGELAHSEHFGRIVSGVKEIDSEFLRGGKRPMGPLPGYERIDPLCGGLEDFTTCSAGHDANPPCDWRSARREMHSVSNGRFDSFFEDLALDFCFDLESDFQERPPWFLETERVAQERVVSELGMRVQRQMSAVDGKVVIDRQLELAILRPGDALQSAPKQARGAR